jgi:hypothetical protein
MSTNIYVNSGDQYGINGSDDRRITLTVTKAGVAVDLTGATLKLLVKRRRSDSDADAVITKTTSSGIALASPQSGATKGVAYLTLDEGDTDDLSGRYLWELEGDDAVGKVTLASGGFYVTPDLVTA